ncbi:hypothetical protein B484DRAFT_469343, partial [Ochromonadaceae sp. CCMP2298]
METYKRINKIQVLDNKIGYTYSWEQRGPDPAMRRQIMVAVPAVVDTAIREAILHFGDDSDVDQGVNGASVSSDVAPPEAEAEPVYDGIDIDMESVDVSEGTDKGEEVSLLGMDARQGNREACREYLTRNIDCVSRQKTLNIVKNLLRRDKADTAVFRRKFGRMMRRAVLTADRTADDLTSVVDKEVDRRVEGRISMMTNARKKRKRGKTVNMMGKGNYLWDSGSTYNIEQLAKNLPGDVRVAGTGDYNIRTANGDLLVVTHYSYVDTVRESVVADIDCRILSTVQLFKTGYTFVGGGNTLVITSPSGVECRGTLTVNDEFIIPKSEVAKLLAAPMRVRVRRDRVMAASDSSADEDEDEESGDLPQNMPGLSERLSSEMEVTAEDLEAEVGTDPE